MTQKLHIWEICVDNWTCQSQNMHKYFFSSQRISVLEEHEVKEAAFYFFVSGFSTKQTSEYSYIGINSPATFSNIEVVINFFPSPLDLSHHHEHYSEKSEYLDKWDYLEKLNYL